MYAAPFAFVRFRFFPKTVSFAKSERVICLLRSFQKELYALPDGVGGVASSYSRHYNVFLCVCRYE